MRNQDEVGRLWEDEPPVKLSPKQIATAFGVPSDAWVERIANRVEPCTHGWEGLDDDPTCAMEFPGLIIKDEMVQP